LPLGHQKSTEYARKDHITFPDLDQVNATIANDYHRFNIVHDALLVGDQDFGLHPTTMSETVKSAYFDNYYEASENSTKKTISTDSAASEMTQLVQTIILTPEEDFHKEDANLKRLEYVHELAVDGFRRVSEEYFKVYEKQIDEFLLNGRISVSRLVHVNFSGTTYL
jgi:hypothetical protein